jgi:hypothetical protein
MVTSEPVTPRQYVNLIVEQTNLQLAWQRELLAAEAAGQPERVVQARFAISRCDAMLVILRTKLYIVSRR